MKKIMALTFSLCLFVSCGGISPIAAERRYNDLSVKFDNMVQGNINENDRQKLEQDFQSLKKDVSGSSDSTVKDIEEQVDEKIQNLKDLKD